MATIEDRIDRLEEMVMRLVYIQQKTEMEIQALKKEMKEFKNEMKEFKNEMKEFKDEMRRTIAEMKEDTERFKNNTNQIIAEMKKDTENLKREMEKFKDEMREEHRKMNKQWGSLANKLGTVVEDIIAPAVSPVIRKYFNCEVNDLQVRRKRKDIKTGLKDEFDVIAVSDVCKTVFLVEVKSFPKVEYINDFKDKKIERFIKLFPEYKEYKLIPIFASLRLDEDLVNYLTKNKIYAMAYREWEYMDLLNFNAVSEN